MRTLRVTLIGLLFAVPAHADIGLPMIAIVWPSMWAVLIPITVVEGAVLKSRLNLSVSTGLRVAFRANLISTAAGIPLTWGILVLMEMVFDHGGGVNTLWQKVVLCAFTRHGCSGLLQTFIGWFPLRH